MISFNQENNRKLSDLLTKTNQKLSATAIVFFEQWKDNASLKSLIKQILK
ncbi:DUF7825 domain-containing protein [Flavobacterium cupreum]